MASPGKRHCANCIGTLSFPIAFSLPSLGPAARLVVFLLASDGLHFRVATRDARFITVQIRKYSSSFICTVCRNEQ